MLLVLIGKTSSGKTLVRDELVTMGFNPIVTYTTRTKRPSEMENKDYKFVTEEKFKEMVEDGYFMEYKAYESAYGTWYYGSPLNEIELSSDDDSLNVIILTPAGYKDFIEYYPNIKHKSIYLYANLSTIKNRLKSRNDAKESERRINADLIDFKGVEELTNKIFYNNDGQNIKELAKRIYEYCLEN